MPRNGSPSLGGWSRIWWLTPVLPAEAAKVLFNCVILLAGMDFWGDAEGNCLPSFCGNKAGLAFSLCQFSSMFPVISSSLSLAIRCLCNTLFGDTLADAVHKATPLIFLEDIVLFFSLASYENDIYATFTMSVN